jgi:hypothetical protein
MDDNEDIDDIPPSVRWADNLWHFALTQSEDVKNEFRQVVEPFLTEAFLLKQIHQIGCACSEPLLTQEISGVLQETTGKKVSAQEVEDYMRKMHLTFDDFHKPLETVIQESPAFKDHLQKLRELEARYLSGAPTPPSWFEKLSGKNRNQNFRMQ